MYLVGCQARLQRCLLQPRVRRGVRHAEHVNSDDVRAQKAGCSAAQLPQRMREPHNYPRHASRQQRRSCSGVAMAIPRLQVDEGRPATGCVAGLAGCLNLC